MACRVALAEIRRYLLACDEDEKIALGVFVEGIGAEVADWITRLRTAGEPGAVILAGGPVETYDRTGISGSPAEKIRTTPEPRRVSAADCTRRQNHSERPCGL